MISIAFDLPFTLQVTPSRDDVLRVRVTVPSRLDPGPDPDPDPLRVVWAHLEVWVGAAMYGMGGVAHPVLQTAPIDPHAALTAALGMPRPDMVSFEIRDVPMSLAYVAVLVHKLYGLQELFEITQVAIEIPPKVAAGAEVRWGRASVSDLPGRPVPLPFAVEDAELPTIADSLVVTLHLDRPLAADEVATLEGGLQMWFAQLMQGGFISPPIDRDNYFCALAHRAPLYVGASVQWELERVAFALRGLDGLLGFFAAFSTRCAPIRRVVFD